MAFRKDTYEATYLSGASNGAQNKNDNKRPRNISRIKNRKNIQKRNSKDNKAKIKKTTEVKHREKLKVIPLGGLGEIGKNLTVFETDSDIIIVDCGLKFPDEEMYGIDSVIPEFTYLLEKKNKIRGLFITHGHEDHIGSIPYLLKNIDVPIYGTRLTIGLLERKLEEHGPDNADLHVVKAGDVIKVRGFSIEFIQSNHSIPDSCCLCIKAGDYTVLHTGDFKIDFTPVDNQQINLQRIAQIGCEGVDLLIADSTNAEKEGHSKSEANVGRTFMQLFNNARNKRIILATFATNIHRVQQVFDAAKTYNRKVALSGRSMVNVVAVAKELGYLNFSNKTLIDLRDVDSYPPKEVIILTTGSQGEPMAALSRMAKGEHRQFKISKNDCVIISAIPIPGNEKMVADVINGIIEMGADVVYHGEDNIHVSGHAYQEELKLMNTIVKPRYFLPAHGENKMLAMHKNLAIELGMNEENVFVMKNGEVLELSEKGARIAGEVPNGLVMIDGLGIGDVGNIVLKDRKKLSEDGLFIIVVSMTREKVVSGPGIVSRGFVYMKESEELLNGAKDIVNGILKRYEGRMFDYNSIKADIKSDIERYLFEKTRRRPMILPVLMYVKID